MMNLTTAAKQAILARSVAVAPGSADAGLLNADYLGLVVACTNSQDTAVAADVTEASFAGYARKAASWDAGGVYVDTDGNGSINSALKTFTPTDALLPQTVIGVALFSAITAGVLHGIELFDDPIEVLGPTTPAKIVTTVSIPKTGDFGETTVID